MAVLLLVSSRGRLGWAWCLRWGKETWSGRFSLLWGAARCGLSRCAKLDASPLSCLGPYLDPPVQWPSVRGWSPAQEGLLPQGSKSCRSLGCACLRPRPTALQGAVLLTVVTTVCVPLTESSLGPVSQYRPWPWPLVHADLTAARPLLRISLQGQRFSSRHLIEALFARVKKIETTSMFVE